MQTFLRLVTDHRTRVLEGIAPVQDAEVRNSSGWNLPGTRFPVSAIIVGVPGLSGVASKMSTRSLPSSASPCRREAYDGRSIDPLSRPSYIPCANRGRSGSQLEDGSSCAGAMELTGRDPA